MMVIPPEKSVGGGNGSVLVFGVQLKRMERPETERKASENKKWFYSL